MRTNRIKKKLLANECFYGPNLHLDSPWLVEMIGHSGFDYVLLDCEHGLVGHNLPIMILAADAAGVVPIVRVPSHDRSYLINALEAGAGGIFVPMIHTPEQAKAIVKETRFPPYGLRGFSNVSRAGKYGKIPAREFSQSANDETVLILMLESTEALDNAVEIAQVPGVDMLFIGPSDFAQSLGYSGQPGHPEVEAAMSELIRKIRKYIPVGISSYLPDKPEDVVKWKEEGVQGFLVSSTHPIRQTFEKLYQNLITEADPGKASPKE